MFSATNCFHLFIYFYLFIFEILLCFKMSPQPCLLYANSY